MAPGRLADATATTKALFNDAHLLFIRPAPTAASIGDGKDLYFGSVSMVGHRAQTTPDASAQKHGLRRRDTNDAHQIESKISGSLRGHADSSTTRPQFEAMRTIWDGRSVPLIATIARNYTESGLSGLVRMLEARHTQWMFDYEIWRWTGDCLEVLAKNTNRIRDPFLFVEEVKIESRPRGLKADLEKLRAFADESGVLHLFDHVIADARRVGLKLDYRTEHVTLTPRHGMGWLPVLPKRSSPDLGLVLDVAWPIVPHLKDLSLQEHGKGHFSYSRYSVRDSATLTRLVEAASAASEDDGALIS